jgi:hypothetical protein
MLTCHTKLLEFVCGGIGDGVDWYSSGILLPNTLHDRLDSILEFVEAIPEFSRLSVYGAYGFSPDYVAKSRFCDLSSEVLV